MIERQLPVGSQRVWLSLLLALACMLTVGWIWHLPQTPAAAEVLAARSVRNQVKMQMARDGSADLQERAAQWMRDNQEQVEQAQQALATRWRDSMSFTAADGQRYTYLGDLDSYAWVRAARNRLTHGTTCDAVRDGECRDTFVNPPHGARMRYQRSLHIDAIAALHRLVSWFNPHFPLTASAAWVAILAGMLTSLLAFVVGRQVAGVAGGVAAGLLIPLHPFVLERCLGSDNDVWNLALPLLFAWSAATAFTTIDRRRRLAALALAGVVAGLHAMTWSGWVFHAAVVLSATGLLVAAGFVRRPRDRRESSTSLVALVTLVLAMAVAIGALTGFEGTGNMLTAALWPPEPSIPVAAQDGVWPPMLNTVTELQRSTFQGLVDQFLGPVGCWVCFTGFAILLLPRRARWWTYLGAAVYGLLLTAAVERAGLASRAYLAATIVPACVLLPWRLLREDTDARPRVIELIVVVWLVASFEMSLRSTRMVLLAVTPFALVAAVAIARAAEILTSPLSRRWPRPAVIDTLVAAIVAAMLAPTVSRSYAEAAVYTPVLNTAWWKVLDHSRRNSAPDAIVTSWWDYGYWVKYLGERRTTTDGASLGTHSSYWIARTLVSRDSQEAIGLLRMLHCGGDNTPFPEGELSAYGRLQHHLRDAVQSHALLLELVRQSRADAAAILAKRGLSTNEQAEILAATHCEPAESYIVLSRELAGPNVWMRIGTWDLRKAFIANALRQTTPETVIREASRRFGVSAEAASELVGQAQSLRLFDFVSGRESRTPPIWYACSPGPTGNSLSCPIELDEVTTGRAIESVEVSLLDPASTRIRVSAANQTEWRSQPPAVLLVAADSLIEVPVPPDPEQDLGVLVDVAHRRVLLGQPAFLTSMYVQLVHLDGRYATGFKKVIEEAAPSGDRISLWRVQFP